MRQWQHAVVISDEQLELSKHAMLRLRRYNNHFVNRNSLLNIFNHLSMNM